MSNPETCMVKFLNFWSSTSFKVNAQEFQLRGSTTGVIPPNDAYGIANCEDPDQTAPVGGQIWVFTECPNLLFQGPHF